MVRLQSERVLQQLGGIEMAKRDLPFSKCKCEHAAFRQASLAPDWSTCRKVLILERRATFFSAERFGEFRFDPPDIA